MIRFCCTACILLFLLPSRIIAQTQLIEQLKSAIEKAPSTTEKLQALFELCEQRQSLNTDTLCKYAYLSQSLSASQKSLESKALASYYVSCCLVKGGDLSKALNICNAYLSKASKQKISISTLQKLKTLKAQILVRSYQYEKGLKEVYEILHTAERTEDTLTQMIARNGIGWINMEMKQANEALRWFYSAISVSGSVNFHEKNSNIYSNIAGIYKQKHKYDSAEYFIKKSLDLSSKQENIFYYANSLNILASIYIDTDRSELAEAPLKEALSIREKIGDPFYIVSDMGLLAIYYANTSRPEKGIALSQEGIKLANTFNISSKLPFLYEALGESYKSAKDYKNYSSILERIQEQKDSMFEANSAAARAEMEAKYDLNKKENLIKLQKSDIRRKNNLILGSALLFVLSISFGLLLFRVFKNNQQIKLLKMQAEEKRISAYEVISARENERKRISRDLHDNIGAYATVLIASTEELKNPKDENHIQITAQQVALNAKKIMSSLQQTIWVLSTDLIIITDFIDRFKLFTKDILRQFPEVRVSYKEQIKNDFELSPSEALNLVRIMQEAFQNSIKHANPRNIIITVIADTTICISIKDDGKGFEMDQVSDGYGILNMKYRANEADYDLDIVSGDSGTELSLKKRSMT